MIRYGISHSSFSGVVGYAIHFFGEAWRYDESMSSGSWVFPRDSKKYDQMYQKFRLEKTINAKEAIDFNKRDSAISGFDSYRAGDVVSRFEDLKELKDVGIQLLIDKYGKDIDIEWGEPYDCDVKYVYGKEKKLLTNLDDLI